MLERVIGIAASAMAGVGVGLTTADLRRAARQGGLVVAATGAFAEHRNR
jgi:hypothetical protein